jgi:hypothetical protein
MPEDFTKFPRDTKTLLEQIGIDPRDFEWQHLAACDGYPVNLFFEFYEKDPATAKQVDELCASCPVAKECYQLGVDTRSTGVFGGFYLQNGEPSKTRNMHKDQETAVRLAKKVLE